MLVTGEGHHKAKTTRVPAWAQEGDGVVVLEDGTTLSKAAIDGTMCLLHASRPDDPNHVEVRVRLSPNAVFTQACCNMQQHLRTNHLPCHE